MKIFIRPILTLACFLLVALLGRAQGPGDLASKARDIMKQHCFDCHGKLPKKLKGKLDLFDRGHLEHKERKILVAKQPDDSELFKRIQDGTMPPESRPRMKEEEVKVLRDWIAAGGQAFAWEKVEDPEKDHVAQRAAHVKEIFRARCLECHGGTKKAAGVHIFDHGMLVQKKRLMPGKADDSLVYQLLIASDQSVMPPQGQPRLSQQELDAVRLWINDGAPAFPTDVEIPAAGKKDPTFKGGVSVEYVLQNILKHIRGVPLKDRPYIRYLSINHLLTDGTTPDMLMLHREALATAINHLSWEPTLAQPMPIDGPAGTVFAIDLRHLGWDVQPYKRYDAKTKNWYASKVNLFDLALLEYPYGIVYEGSETFDELLSELIVPSGMILPIPYVRADWFVSTILQPPFYEDFLRLPYEVHDLEKKLGVYSNDNFHKLIAKRGGMAVSGVSRNNRVVERHPLKYWGGAYWKSYDFRTSKGLENIFRDPIYFHPAGGELIWHLPNGLQGYFLVDNKSVRVELAPTDIVTDKFAEDKTVRNGLACMRCHDRGMKEFVDGVRPALLRMPDSPGFDKRFALGLYPDQREMDVMVKDDGDRFRNSMAKLLGKPLTRPYSPLTPVTTRYLDYPLHLHTAAGELGMNEAAGLRELFRTPLFIGLGVAALSAEGGVVRRDAWDEYFAEVVSGLGLGIPIVPLDGIGLRDYPTIHEPFKVAFITKNFKTDKKQSVFESGDEVQISVKNEAKRPIWIELIGTSSRGKKVMLTSYPLKVEAGDTYKYPALKIKGGVGKEGITLYASYQEFPAGELLRGDYVSDRVVHRYYGYQKDGNRWTRPLDAAGIVKRTIDIETK